ncbi:MAG TPA: ECF-type sigma factor [Bryobacteraceae bacterium]|nr:ECF-type sigma factor [Bryobacteraceae bacterium]
MSLSASELFVEPRSGSHFAVPEVSPDLYRDLRRIAARHLGSERRNHTLQPTALVNEAYLKLFNGQGQQFNDDVHFLSVASRVMRQVLIDYARSRATQKRNDPGSQVISATSIEIQGENGAQLMDLIALDDALAALAADNERLARLVEMRFFGGMTAEESAEALGISVHVVRHELRFAQAWLRRKLSS